MEQYVKYLRKSRFDRDYAELSVEETLKRHEAILDRIVKDRGYYVAKTYYEVVSGESIAARPEIQKMLEEVSAGIYAGVLVVDVERLARGNGADQAYISQVFQFSSTKIITPTKIYDPSNEFDEEYFEFGLFMSRREYKTINRRLVRGRDSSASEGKWMNTIIRKLFDKNFKYARKILSLEPREVYTFVINNADRLKHIVREAMAAELAQLQLDIKTVSKVQFRIPQSCLFTYDGTAKTQLEMKKNVYRGYISSAEVRSSSERKFEKYCEHADSVDWVYKNGDKGNEYLSIVYADNSEKQKNFYPDYIISVRGKIWIIETKGGFDRSGNSQDIDIYTPKKFTVLKDYLERYELKGGIVRYDDKSEELCICTENYSDDISSDSWKLLSEVLD